MEYRASHRFADMSARKIRPFAALVRGKALDEALQLLKFVPNRGARLLEQVLLSARGNALDKGARDVEDLIVSESRVDDGPMFKRFMPRARGTAYSILRRMAHIRIALAEEEVDTTSPLDDMPSPIVTTPVTSETSLPAPAGEEKPAEGGAKAEPTNTPNS
jgi:large subunit ribosomal protein L22